VVMVWRSGPVEHEGLGGGGMTSPALVHFLSARTQRLHPSMQQQLPTGLKRPT
jgi:hypothetical protein